MTSPLSKIEVHVHCAPDDAAIKEGFGSQYSPEELPEDDVQLGVKKVNAIRQGKVWGRKSTIWLWAGMFLLHFSQAFEGSTTFLYIAYATSSFSLHSLLGTAATVATLTSAITSPIVAKLCDLVGRAEACIIGMILYTCGMILFASSTGIGSYAGGNILDSVGQNAIQMVIGIIIGDLVSLRWRSLVYYGLALDWILFAFVGSNVGAAIIDGPGGWRWGQCYGMFAVIIPVCSVPVIGALLWSQIRAKRLGVIHSLNPNKALIQRTYAEQEQESLVLRAKAWANEIDLVGLILLGAGWTCLLLPLTLANGGDLPFSNYKIIIMLTFGPTLLLAFTFWEAKFAKSPCLPARFFGNRNVILSCGVGFSSSIAFYLQYLYQYSFLYVTKPDWSTKDLSYFAQIQSVSTVIFAIMAGALIAYFQWYKVILLVGLAIKLLGTGLMIRSRGANGSTAELVISQLLQGAGWGFYSAVTQTVSQAAVPSADLATVTAFFLLVARIGSSIGNTITTAIWRDLMPKKLASQLTGVTDQATIDSIFNSILTVAELDANDPVRSGAMQAYADTMLVLVILATIFCIPPIVMALCMKDLKLDHRFSAVSGELGPDVESSPSKRREASSVDEKSIE